VSDSQHLAIDLGAGSGRGFLGCFEAGGFELKEVHRFRYEPRLRQGRLRWDAARLFAGLRASLREARTAAGGRPIRSVGVDSWAVDYGLIDAEGRLLEEPVCYRDPRTDGVMQEVFDRVPRSRIYARTGIQFLQLNTLYQLFAHVRDGLPPGAFRLLLIPDLCHHFLCGSRSSERTNASTTQLLDAVRGAWDAELFAPLGLPLELMPEVLPAGSTLGVLREELAAEVAGEPPQVIAPATHDTASAVAGTPLSAGWAFVSSGTWSLVGVETDAPLLDEAAAAANLTNEAGAYGNVRLLKNVMGLWLLECARKEWEAEGRGLELPRLVAAAAEVRGFPGFVYPDAPRFFKPQSMLRELRAALQESGQTPHDDPVLMTRVILDSLALRYASVAETLERSTGRPIEGLHIVGGGSRNDYLNQATADAAGRPVQAGPEEATVCGNLLVQAIAAGALASLAEGRERLAAALPPRRYAPRRSAAWAEAARRYRELEPA
jgi:rhamnulokinase